LRRHIGQDCRFDAGRYRRCVLAGRVLAGRLARGCIGAARLGRIGTSLARRDIGRGLGSVRPLRRLDVASRGGAWRGIAPRRLRLRVGPGSGLGLVPIGEGGIEHRVEGGFRLLGAVPAATRKGGIRTHRRNNGF
jgi:hypothetical protein